MIEETPDLRIIDDALSHRVAERLDDIGNSPTERALKSSRFWEHRRAKHLLTELAFCGHCNRKLTPVGKDYLRCTSTHRDDGCANGKSIKRGTLQHRLDTLEQERQALAAKLSAPQSAPVHLHPNLAELYRRKVETLHNALRDEASGPEALEIMRSLIAQVNVAYSKEDGFTIELISEIAAMVLAAQSEVGPQRKNAAPERTANGH